MYHIRCFSCGKVFGTNCWVSFLSADEKLKMNVLKSFHIKRYCCTRMFLSYVDVDDILVYHKQTTIQKHKNHNKWDVGAFWTYNVPFLFVVSNIIKLKRCVYSNMSKITHVADIHISSTQQCLCSWWYTDSNVDFLLDLWSYINCRWSIYYFFVFRCGGHCSNIFSCLHLQHVLF